MTTDTTADTDTPEGAEAPQPAPDAPGTESPAPGAEAGEIERQLDEARAQLRTAETRVQESVDRWQRAQADLANFRRRTQFEREEQEKYAAAGLVAALLPVLDSFDRAWGSLPGQFRHLTWLSGVAMIHSQLRGTLERVGLEEIHAEGQPFDPGRHEAVASAPDLGSSPPHVVAVLQAGYTLHQRVIRPTLVKVGPKPEVPSPKPDSDEAPAEPEAPAETQTPDAQT